MARQRKLWKELGGSDEGWQQWTDFAPLRTLQGGPGPTVPNRADGSAVGRKLPPLSAKDIIGNTWTLDRLAGKTTVAVVWATWCEPCRAELPYFAKLAARLNGRDDVLAISISIDDNIAIAESFAKSRNYTFPVLSAKEYTEDLMSHFFIPRTWIIRNGTIVEEVSGFGADGEKWVEEMLARLK